MHARVFFAALSMSSLVRAEEVGTGVKAVTEGKVEVAKTGFTKLEKKDEKVEITEVSASLGALLAAGNSRSMAVTGAVKSKIRRDMHQFTGATALNYAQTGRPGEGTETTVENLQFLLRYDLFFTDRFGAFTKVSALHDRFQGLDLRFNVDPGLSYSIVSETRRPAGADKQELFLRVWVEAGYDFLVDVRRDDALVVMGMTLPKTQTNHGARGFVGYDHKLNENVALLGGVEYLQAFTDTNAWRVNADASIKASLSKKFALATSVQLRYDHAPLPGKQDTDVLTAVSLVYALF